MSLAHMPKALVAGLVAAVVVTTAGVAWTVVDQGDTGGKGVRRIQGAVDKSLGLVPADGTTLDPDGAPTSADGSVERGGASAQADSQASSGRGGAGGGATAGAAVGGSAGGGGVSGNAGTGGSGGTGGQLPPAAGPVGGAGGTAPGGGGTGTGSGGTGGAGSSGGGSGGSGGPVVTTPVVPSVQPDVSPYREGSYDLYVPGTPGVSKKLCLSGEVNRCETVTVTPLQGTKVTVSYSANTSATAPTFSIFPCPGGMGVTVGNISPGTDVRVQAQGVSVTAKLSGQEVSQSASLCDA